MSSRQSRRHIGRLPSCKRCPRAPAGRARDAEPRPCAVHLPTRSCCHTVTVRWWRRATGLATWARLLIVVTLWLAGPGIRQLGAPGGLLNAAGRLTDEETAKHIRAFLGAFAQWIALISRKEPPGR